MWCLVRGGAYVRDLALLIHRFVLSISLNTYTLIFVGMFFKLGQYNILRRISIYKNTDQVNILPSMRRVLITSLFLLFGLQAFCQHGRWTGFITQDGIEYPIDIVIEKDGKDLTGVTSVMIADSIYGGKFYGKLYKDRSMTLWDHTPIPEIYPKELPLTMRRRYQMVYRRSISGDTIKGHWQQVRKTEGSKYKLGRIELRRMKQTKKA